MLPKQERLSRRGEFRGVYERGRSYAHRCLVLFVLPGQADTRVGFSVPARLGGAVVRNRIRRRLRASYRALRPEVPHGWHLVVIARAGSRGLEVDELSRVLRELLRQALESEGNRHGGNRDNRLGGAHG